MQLIQYNFMSHTKAIMHLTQIFIYKVGKKKQGIRCKHYSYYSWQKGTFWNKVILISEEIKHVALAFLKLYLSEGNAK